MMIVFRLIFATFAVVSIGAMMSATTAGRIPLNIALRVGSFLIVSGVRKIAIASIMKKEGSIVPNAAHRLPLMPFSLSPITTAMFTASMPGIA